MHSKIMGPMCMLCCSFIWFGQLYCFEFDQNYFGVVFSPYMKDLSIHPAETITRSNIKSMLTVTSRKFSKLLVGAARELVKFDYYYSQGSYASVYVGEMAAIMNRENGSKTINIIYQLIDFGTVQQVRWDISVALEAAEKANVIFPGTVEGISLDGLEDLHGTLSNLHTYRSLASTLGVKLGAMLDCYQLGQKKNETWYSISKQIVQAADFIICHSVTFPPFLGPAKVWSSIRTDFMSFKHLIRQINSSVQVMGQTMWSSSDPEKWGSVENFRWYWEMVSKWAGENQYQIYMQEAFDNDNRLTPSFKHFGWWKLGPNSDVDSVEEYREKVSAYGDNTGNDDLSKGLTEQSFVLVTIVGVFVAFYFQVT